MTGVLHILPGMRDGVLDTPYIVIFDYADATGELSHSTLVTAINDTTLVGYE